MKKRYLVLFISLIAVSLLFAAAAVLIYPHLAPVKEHSAPVSAPATHGEATPDQGSPTEETRIATADEAADEGLPDDTDELNSLLSP